MKDCPKCGTQHNKPGKFCSRSCANSRQWNDEHKKIFSEKQAAYMSRPESEDHRNYKADQMKLHHLKRNLSEDEDPDDIMTNPDDFFLVSPRDDFDSKFIQDGDYWEEV
ncbi:hypothetical protein EBU95_15855 [bacterium]|nr:hypothetical protein [bacterium]